VRCLGPSRTGTFARSATGRIRRGEHDHRPEEIRSRSIRHAALSAGRSARARAVYRSRFHAEVFYQDLRLPDE